MSNYDLGSVTTPVTRTNFGLSEFAPTDVFEFSFTGTRNINLSLTDISAGDDADLRLYRDSNGNGVFDATDSFVASSIRGSNLDDSINIQAAGGTYFAEVSRFAPGSSGAVTYDFAVSTTALTSPSDLLPEEVQVGNLNSDRTLSGRVDTSDTADTYAFSLGLFEGVNISLTGLSADADIRVIRDSNINGIVDAGEVMGSSVRAGNANELISNIVDSGNYLLEVYSFNGAQTNYQATFDHFTTAFA